MAIYNLGGINVDYFYRVPHLPAPGETINAESLTTGLGGKGVNISVAAARAGAVVHHAGALGPDSDWIREQLRSDGVEVDAISSVDTPTGQGIIYVDDAGENSIVVFPGANREINQSVLESALESACPGDIVVAQNETSSQKFWAETGSKTGAPNGDIWWQSASESHGQRGTEPQPHQDRADRSHHASRLARQ